MSLLGDCSRGAGAGSVSAMTDGGIIRGLLCGAEVSRVSSFFQLRAG